AGDRALATGREGPGRRGGAGTAAGFGRGRRDGARTRGPARLRRLGGECSQGRRVAAPRREATRLLRVPPGERTARVRVARPGRPHIRVALFALRRGAAHVGEGV